MTFAPSTISSFKPATANSRPRLVQQFFGLFGPNGPLPLHLTEFARERLLHFRDPSLIRFLDLLHHRPLSLFYRAWAQAQPTVCLDRPDDDRFANYVGSLLGMGTPALRNRDASGDHIKLFFAGFMSRQVKTAEGLRSILSGFFRFPVRIIEFSGHWLRLPEDDLSRLGAPRACAQLGRGAVLGNKVWDRQHRIQIAFGPLNYAQYDSLLPGGSALKRLVPLVRQYLGFEYDWDVRLSLAGENIPRARLGRHTRLGWSSWVGSRPKTQAAENLVLDVERIIQTQAPQDKNS